VRAAAAAPAAGPHSAAPGKPSPLIAGIPADALKRKLDSMTPEQRIALMQRVSRLTAAQQAQQAPQQPKPAGSAAAAAR
jgi:hypothetical protein